MTEVRMTYESKKLTTRVFPHTHFDATPEEVSGVYTHLGMAGAADVYAVFTPRNGSLELSYVESAE